MTSANFFVYKNTGIILGVGILLLLFRSKDILAGQSDNIAQTRAIMAYYLPQNEIGRRVAVAQDQSCAHSIGNEVQPTHLEGFLWQARWAYATCSRSALAQVAQTPTTTQSSDVARFFIAYANWDLGDEAQFLAILPATARSSRYFYEIGKVAFDQKDWKQVFYYDHLAYELGERDMWLLYGYAVSELKIEGDPYHALAIMTEATALYPEDYRMYNVVRSINMSALPEADLVSAEAAHKKACQTGLAPAECSLWHGRIAYQRADYPTALAHSKKALHFSSEDYYPDGLFLQATALIAMNDTQTALPLLQQLTENDEANQYFMTEYIQALYELDDVATAQQACTQFFIACEQCRQDSTILERLSAIPGCVP